MTDWKQLLLELYAQEAARIPRLPFAPEQQAFSIPSVLDRLRELLGIQTPLPVHAVSLAERPEEALARALQRVAWRAWNVPDVDPQLLELRKAIARTAGVPDARQKRFLMQLAERLAQRYGRPAEAIYKAELDRYMQGVKAGILSPELVGSEQFDEAMKAWSKQMWESSKKDEKR